MSSAKDREPPQPEGNGAAWKLRHHLRQTVGSLGIRKPYALLDYPDLPDAGEGAAWLGALSCLKAVTGASPAYVSKRANTAWDRLARVPGDIILFGRSTPSESERSLLAFRQEVLQRTSQGQRIIQLPATVTASGDADTWIKALAGAKARPILLFGDPANLKRLAHTSCDVILSPPMVAGLLLSQRAHPGAEDVYLCTSAGRATAGPPDDALRAWIEEPLGLHKRLAARALLQGGLSRDRQRFWLYFFMAQARLARGIALIGPAKCVTTDILAVYLLGLILQARIRTAPYAPDIDDFRGTWRERLFPIAEGAANDAW